MVPFQHKKESILLAISSFKFRPSFRDCHSGVGQAEQPCSSLLSVANIITNRYRFRSARSNHRDLVFPSYRLDGQG